MNTFDNSKRYKMYLVELDDEDRERVISGLVQDAEFESNIDYDNVEVDRLLDSVRIFSTPTSMTVKFNLIPREDGTYFTVENFLEQDSGEDLLYSEEEEEWYE